jgi:chromosome segregation ATPase
LERDFRDVRNAERRNHETALENERKRHDAKERRDASTIESLAITVDKLRTKLDELKEALRTTERQLEEKRREHVVTQAGLASAAQEQERLTARVAQLAQEGQDALAAMTAGEAAHRQQLDALIHEHSVQIAQLRADHTAALDRLNQHHEASTQELRLANDARITDLRKELGRGSKKGAHKGAAPK